MIKRDIPEILKPDIMAFNGGCNTLLKSQQIPMGMYSMVQNMRDTHPGKKQRKGQRKQHSTSNGNAVKSIYQFNKIRVSERHLFAQFGDDVLEAANDPPDTSIGVFGTEVFSGSGDSIPASWSNLKDALLFSNGVDQHQIYYGTLTYVDRLIHYKGSAAPPSIPVEGYDYSEEASDGDTSTVVVLDSLDTYANNECLFIMTPVMPSSHTFTISKANTNASVLSVYYWNGAWTAVSDLDDGTNDSGKTFGKTGKISWTHPSDAIPKYMYGECGYWIQYRVSAQLSNEVEATKVQFDAPWQSIKNVWDGIKVDVIETQFYDASADIYKTFGAFSIEIDEMAPSDKLYFASPDPICAIYVDVGTKPNTTADTTVDAVYHWDGTAYVSVGTISDGTNGLSNSGWITFARVNSHKRQFNKNQYYAYWYYLTVDKTLSDDVIISLYTQPYFDVSNFGNGYCNTVWKERAVYGFDKDQYIYVSAKGRPQVLNGDDSALLEPGDGRSNRPVAMRVFNNELIVWQEEKGKEGGCITLFEGYSPNTFGKVLITDKLGTMNNNTVVVVDGIYTSTSTDEVVEKLAFFVSRAGVFMTNGHHITGISDNIQNYFDPLKDECIRRGYEKKAWMGHDTAYNVIRIGLVSGISVQTSKATSTSPNHLIDSDGAFTTRKIVSGHPIAHTIAVGDTVYNTTNGTSALITAVNSETDLTLDADIMASGEGYEIYAGTCNLFPVLDLSNLKNPWSFDVFAQNPTCMTEVEAASGDSVVVQLVGTDGYVYQSNYGTDDDSTAVDSYVDVELNALGREMEIREIILAMVKGGHLSITAYEDGTPQTPLTETSVPLVRNKYDVCYRGMDMKVRVEHNTAGESFRIFGIGFRMYSNEAR